MTYHYSSYSTIQTDIVVWQPISINKMMKNVNQYLHFWIKTRIK